MLPSSSSSSCSGSTPATQLTVKSSLCRLQKCDRLRTAWRIISSIEQKGGKNEEHVVLVKEYRSKMEGDLSYVCASILTLLDSNLISTVAASLSKVFYLKMKGDYQRYLAEFKVDDERKAAAEDTMLSYTTSITFYNGVWL
ncbi:14-3-3-like protein GF14 lambda [Hibiscus syriacus]|uniref:14-3-3-like protein GF14 lambda n=1 Tax=Hibiscus syriacus TaxID=106335 RepID=A0A6A2Z5G1_HIBSY|nr:14-3-3-like protein GF14 lambda [Hibiscus syriacus]